MWAYIYSIFLCINFVSIECGTNKNSVKHMNHDTEPDCKNGKLLSSLVCIPEGYLKGEVPVLPTTVRARIEINNILEVNDKKMRITLDFYQELLWFDNRINIRSSNKSSVSVLNNNLIDYIWKPDLWIKNLFEFKLHGILEPTGGLIIMRENTPSCELLNCTNKGSKENTLVTYNMEAQATIHCNFYFVNYPMDTQVCEFVMDVSYPHPNIVNLAFELGWFGVTNKNSNIDDFSIDITFEDNSNQTGIHAIIRLERCILPFIIKCYLPCIAIITVSLISFLISVDSIPARVGLLVTQFLTVTNILIAQQAESPSSGKFTALGIYLLASLFFVVAGFIEFAFVLQLGRYNEKTSKPLTKFIRNGKINTVDLSPAENNGDDDYYYCNRHQKFNLRKIDMWAFIVCGLLFILFNAVYWPTFLLFNFN